MHLFAYLLSYCLWAAWHLAGGILLPSAFPGGFVMDTAVKAVVWIAPAALLLKSNDDWLISPKEMLWGPFPWFPTFICLCLTVAFLHTMHIVLVGIDKWGIYQPMWINMSMSAAIIEEIAFRGFLFNGQGARRRVQIAATCNGLLFAVYHYPQFVLGQDLSALISFRFWLLVVMGTFFSMAFAKWKNLTMTIVIHFVWNMLCFWFALT